MGNESSCCNLTNADEKSNETVLQKIHHIPDSMSRVDEKSSKDPTSQSGAEGPANQIHLEIPETWNLPALVAEIRAKYGPFGFIPPIEGDMRLLDTDHGQYYGTVKDNMPNGIGMLLKHGGELVEGYFAQGKPDRRASVYFPDGSYFSGEWREGRIEGVGEFRHEGGRGKYVGEWKEDLQWGEGEEVVQDEYHYKGAFVSGERQGHGVLVLADSSSYAGDFQQGKFHGRGKYHWNDGKVYHGDWRCGAIDGIGEFTWPDGKKYVGSYKNEKKHGFGVLYWSNGARYEGLWQDGKQHGRGKLILPTGEEYDTNWVNGQMVREESDR